MPRPARLRDRPALVAATVGLALLETAVVWVLGPRTGLALAPQVSAPPPFGAFHDLRWIAVYTPSWFAVVAAVGAFLVVRTSVTALLVGLAWPTIAGRPPARALVRRAARGTVVVAVLLVPWVVLTFATAVLSLSYPWIVAVPVVLMLAVVVHPAPVDPAWGRGAPTRGGVGAVLVAVVVVTAAGGVLAAGPGWTRIPVVVAAGWMNAWCWLRIVHAAAPAGAETGAEARPPSGGAAGRSRPFAVMAVAAILALVLGGTAAGFAVAVALERDRAPTPRADPTASGPPVLVVKGFDSGWDGTTRRWVPGDFRIARFSYAGLDRRGRPRPYEEADTHASVRTTARRLGRQVEALAAETGRPVGIVAESEGALVALTYVLGTPDAPVRAVAVLSPLVQPGRVSYPAPGRVGWGVAAGAALDGIGAVVERLGPVDVDASTPLFRSMVEKAPLFQGLLRCRAPGVRTLAVLPFDTALAAPVPNPVEIPYVVRPAFHGGLIGDDVTARLVARTMRDRPVDARSGWRTAESVVAALASPWQVPSLAPTLEPAWRELPEPDDCDGVRRALARYLAG